LADPVRFGEDFELDLRAYELRRAGCALRLERIPMDLLVLLVERRRELVTRDQIIEKIWGKDVFLDADGSINSAIRKIRHVLGDDPDQPRFVQTVSGRGYRFIAPIEEVSPPPAQAADLQIAHPNNLLGKKISHYRVLEMLGGGGMGVVYKAEDLKLGRLVALKFLPSELASDSIAFERLQREARAASALDHPNICSIYQLDEHEGQPFIVMQLLEGQTLRAWIEAAATQDTAARAKGLVELAIQIADGLEAAHEKGIIHRDIKPANIFITSRGQAKILDFGVAKLVGTGDGPDVKGDAHRAATEGRVAATAADPHLTQTGVSVGTPSYLSPELIRREKLDARTDLFSFGLVLYEMATGQRAFSGNTATVIRDAVLNLPAVPVRQLNPEIPVELEGIIDRALEKDRELRYQHAADVRTDLQRLKRATESGLPAVSRISAKSANADVGVPVPAEAASKSTRRSKVLFPLALLTIALVAGAFNYRLRHLPKLTEKDTIVLADFTNTTGDAVFDDTLKQGLSVQLAQSPFLDLISERRVNETLKLMGRPAGDRLTPEVTREVCLRTGSKAMLSGSITGLGSQYVIGLKVVNCDAGDVLAEAQEQAASKEAVLKALDAGAITLRSKLGESVRSVQKYATPLVEATTPSLEALKAYSLGQKTFSTKGETVSLPFFKRAVELDPNFAVAYASISNAYANLNQAGLAAEYSQKAYGLREKASEVERFAIEVNYYEVMGDLEEVEQASEQWQQTYPRDMRPVRELGYVYTTLGNHEKALEQARAAMLMGGRGQTLYLNLGASYINLNRWDEAEAVFLETEQRKLGGEFLPAYRYQLAFLRGDTARMTQLAVTAMGKPGTEDVLLAEQADTEGWYGRLKNARKLTQSAIESARHNDAKETAAVYQAAAALREVESGNRERARADADAGLKLAQNRDVREMAALALARAGDTTRAEKLGAELDKTFPQNTLVQRYWLPGIRAAVALQRKDPNRAIELLKVSSAMELGAPSTLQISLCPVYVRGEAYLMLHDGNRAAAEFQKFIDHRGLVGGFPWGALARLGLARSYALQGDKTKASAAYQDFLTLWKDADPDIPILRKAKAEYARLQ
jgi:serine/threonine protein kinase